MAHATAWNGPSGQSTWRYDPAQVPGRAARCGPRVGPVGVDPPPELTSIYRALVRKRPHPAKARRRAKASYRRWERGRPTELWQMDIMDGIWLTDSRELKAVTWGWP
jgi:hypothetical protein